MVGFGTIADSTARRRRTSPTALDVTALDVDGRVARAMLATLAQSCATPIGCRRPKAAHQRKQA
jgi:hypothetical protein